MKSALAAEVTRVHEGLKRAFAKVRGEMDEHLDAINENTQAATQNTEELHAVQAHLRELESRLTALAERIDHLQLAHDEFLTRHEQELFMLLYASPHALSADEIAQRLRIPTLIVERRLASLHAKRVPLRTQQRDGILCYRIDEEFRDLQARTNILRVDRAVTQRLIADFVL